MSNAPVFARSRAYVAVCRFVVASFLLAGAPVSRPVAAAAPPFPLQAGCTPETSPIAPGQTLDGDLAPDDCLSPVRPESPYDVWTFAASAGTEYTVGMGSEYFDAYVTVRAPSGLAVASNDDASGSTSNARVHFTAASGGTYRIETTCDQPRFGPYQVSLASGPCPPAATPLAAGQSLPGRLTDADCFGATRATSYADVYSVQATSGTQYTLVMRTPGDAVDEEEDPQSFDPYLVLRGPNGAIVAQNNDGGVGWNARIQFTAAATGAYTVEATSFVAGATGTYQIELAEGACPRPATPIAVGQTLGGRLAEVDCTSSVQTGNPSDLFSFSASSGQQYRITMTDDGTGDPVHFIDPYLVLRNSAGTVVAQNDNGAGFQNAAISYTAQSSGALTIEATSATEGTGGYMLTVQATACPVPPTPIAPGQTLSGALTVSDCFGDGGGNYTDRFAFVATADVQYRITGAPVATDGSFLPLVHLRNPSGGLVDSEHGTIIYTPTVSGTYTIEITTDSPSATGAYTLRLLAATCPAPAVFFSESQSVTGSLDVTDCVDNNGSYDRLAFQATSDRMYKVIVSSTAFDPRVNILNERGYSPFCCEFGTRTVTYKPRVNGVVNVQVGNFNGTGAYTARLESYVCGSANQTISTGQTVSGELATTDCFSNNYTQLQPRYQDTYNFAATAGQTYVVTVDSQVYTPAFRLTNPSGAVVVDNTPVQPTTTLSYTYTAPVTGVHSIEVASRDQLRTGAYTVSLANGAACQSETTTISGGQTLSGSLEADDCYNATPFWSRTSQYDRFQIQMQAGTRYTIRLDSDDVDPLMILRAPDGEVVKTEIDPSPPGSGFPGRTAITLFTPSASGTYSVDASSARAGDYGPYTVSISSNASCQNVVTPIQINSSTPGALTADDCDSAIRPNAYRDRYSFVGTAGATVRIAMDATSVDPFLALFDPSGAMIATDDDGGIGDDARIVVTLPASGTYVIEATCFQSNWTGEYTLRLDDGSGASCTPDVHAFTFYGTDYAGLTGAECSAVSRPGSFADLWTFQADAGRPYIVSLSSTEFDAYVAVLDASGAVVAENDDGGGGLNASLTFTPQTAGTYTIEATSDAPDSIGFYQVTVIPGQRGLQCVPPATPLAVGQTVNGALDITDCYSEINDGAFHDRYAFDAVAGKTYLVRMQALAGQTSLDPWIVLFFGGDGALVQGDDSDDGTTAAEIVFTAPEDERYTFEATSADFEQTGYYTVSVEETTPDPIERNGTSQARAGCTTRTIKADPNRKIANSLVATDCLAPERPSSFQTRYRLDAAAGVTYTIAMQSNEIDSRLFLVGPSGQVVAEDDNGAGKLDARVTVTPQASGVYTIVATSTAPAQTGSYELAVAGRKAETIGVYSPSNGLWLLRNANDPGVATTAFYYGPAASGWTALDGDWNGDGRATAGLYDPATGRFYLRNGNTPGNADATFQFGPAGAGWTPLVGDWNGDGIDTIGLYDPATGVFYLRNSNDSGFANLTFQFGADNSGYVPLAGDWDGDGDDTVGLYRPSTGLFYLRDDHAAGAANHTFPFGPAGAGWLPVVGDWNADGRATVGLYNPAAGAFYLRNEHAAGAADRAFAYGSPGLVPLAGSWYGR